MACLILTMQVVMNRLYLVSSSLSSSSSSPNNNNYHAASADLIRRCDEQLRKKKLNFSSSLMMTVTTTKKRATATMTTTTPTTTAANNNNYYNKNNNHREHFCSTTIMGEKQRWNHHKKIISYAIFGPTTTTTSTTATTDNNNTNSNSSSSSAAAAPELPDWVVHGMERNIFDAQLYYPDWIVRIHTFDLPTSLHDKWLIHKARTFHNVELVSCFANHTLMTKSTSRKMLSRLLPYDDPKVWYTMVRDADSRISLREVMAVQEFIRESIAMDNMEENNNNNNGDEGSSQLEPSQTTTIIQDNPIYFHVMRDHPGHIVPIMGGMFGMKRGLLSHAKTTTTTTTSSSSSNNNNNNSNNSTTITMSQLIHQALQEHPDTLGGCCGEDQQFLRAYLWPLVRHVTLDHDMSPRRCRDFGSHQCYDFPLGPRDESIDYFVGSAFKYKHPTTGEWHLNPLRHDCTIQCQLVNDTTTTTME